MVINDKINEIKEKHDVECILQVGNKNGNDIDLFVFISENGDFLREVKEIKGVNIDISYMPFNILELGIKEKWSFLINSLQKYEVLYKKNNDILLIIEKIKKV